MVPVRTVNKGISPNNILGARVTHGVQSVRKNLETNTLHQSGLIFLPQFSWCSSVLAFKLIYLWQKQNQIFLMFLSLACCADVFFFFILANSSKKNNVCWSERLIEFQYGGAIAFLANQNLLSKYWKVTRRLLIEQL